MFPVMVIGIGAAGLTLTTVTAGRDGLRRMLARMRPGHARARWYLLVLLPPAATVAVLLVLQAGVSPVFASRGLTPGLC
jgi:hypothetical protein